MRPFTLLLVLAAALTPAPLRTGEAEDAAIELIETLGGQITRDRKSPGEPVVEVVLVGDMVTDADVKYVAERLKRLRTLNLSRTKISSAGLQPLALLEDLEELQLEWTAVGGASLRRLLPLKKLHSLNLSCTALTDEGPRHLAGLQSLRALDLSGTKVTDEGVRMLAGLKELDSLDLRHTHLTDEGLQTLTALKKLRILYCDFTNLTERGLSSLAQLPGLRKLSLSCLDHLSGPAAAHLENLKHLKELTIRCVRSDNSQVPANATDDALAVLLRLPALEKLTYCGSSNFTDAGFAGLSSSNRLQELDIFSAPGLTDAGLKNLKNLQELRRLSIWNTKVTPEGQAWLMEALPCCVIDIRPENDPGWYVVPSSRN